MAITLRNTKGAPLTHTELDTNFNDLDTLKAPKASPTFTGTLTCTTITHTGHALKIGSTGSGLGGQVRLINDAGVSAWQAGILGSAGAVNYTIYYEPDPRQVITIAPAGNITVSAPTSGTTLAISAVNATTPAINFVTNTGVTTVGAAGAASALPANPVGYIVIAVGGTNYKVPYYNT